MNNQSIRFARQALSGTAVSLAVLFAAAGPAVAQVSIGISSPGVSIGINMPTYPQLVRVPNYPVYYAPGQQANYFFYDGMYWVYQQDNWYASTWYNGPWGLVGSEAVPLFVLRVPVRYYRNPPQYFRGWRADAPPRWGDHWGNQWAQQHSGWDRWDRRAIPAPAPLPVYQRQYTGARYPHAEQQHILQTTNYRYQPHEVVVRQQYQQQAAHANAPEQQGRTVAPARPQMESQPQHMQAPPARPQPQQPQQAAREQQATERGHESAPPAAHAQGQEQRQAAGKGRGQEKERENEGERGKQGNGK
jgi:hypothetical protein